MTSRSSLDRGAGRGGDPPFRPISEYGVVGNLETCGLVAPDGSLDWFPFPHLESPTICAAILDPDRGGRFRVGPAQSARGEQRYVGRTNVLETTFRTTDGTTTLTDFLPPADRTGHPKQVLYRKATCLEGTVDVEVTFEPRFDYGRAETTFATTDDGVRAEGDDAQALLEGPVDFDVRGDRVVGRLAQTAGDTDWFVLRTTGGEEADVTPEAALADTVQYWDRWVDSCGPGDVECVFEGPWHDLAVRSGLVLKLLTHHDSGAVAAAGTASLPEDVGGVRNWDYRFNWLRDAGFTVQALSNLGHTDEANAYLDWFFDLAKTTDPAAFQPVYGLHGETDLREEELDHLTGYRNSRPVRIGNEAAEQTQLDVYGELLLAVDEMLEQGRQLTDEEWTAVHDVVEHVRGHWDERDAGIWEVRGGDRHFVYSKVMCWAALDRGIAIATRNGRDAPVDAWRAAREHVAADVLERGYDEDVGSFVQAYDGDALDATGLLLPVVGFLPFDDERVQRTIETVVDRLLVDDVLVRRYDGSDGLPGEEGAFVLCSCWLVDALTLSGRTAEARARFERLVDHVSPLGLISEEVDPETGALLGNFPQAFSHVGIVNSALYLGLAEGYEQPGIEPMGVRLGDPVDGALE